MMDDLISKQEALELVRDVCDAIMSCCGSHYDEETEDEVYDDVREVDAILKCNKEIRIALKNMPPAQPEIVRCRECKYYDASIIEDSSGVFYCPMGIDGCYPDDFCNYGERRDDE